MRRAALLIPFLLVFALFGCKKSNPYAYGGKPIPRFSKKIVSLSPGATELIFSMGASQRLVGRTESCNRPDAVKKVPVVAGVKPNYEEIAKLEPDLVVYDQALYNETDIEKIRQLGAESVVLQANSVEGFVDEIYALGRALSKETTASTYADNIVRARYRAEGDPIANKPKVVLLLPGSGTEHMIDGKGSFRSDLIRVSGGEPAGPVGDKFVPLSAETLVQTNPDVILVAGDQAAVDSIVKDARLSGINAFKNKRIFGVNQDVILRKGSQIHLLIDRLHSLFVGN